MLEATTVCHLGSQVGGELYEDVTLLQAGLPAYLDCHTGRPSGGLSDLHR